MRQWRKDAGEHNLDATKKLQKEKFEQKDPEWYLKQVRHRGRKMKITIAMMQLMIPALPPPAFLQLIEKSGLMPWYTYPENLKNKWRHPQPQENLTDTVESVIIDNEVINQGVDNEAI